MPRRIMTVLKEKGDQCNIRKVVICYVMLCLIGVYFLGFVHRKLLQRFLSHLSYCWLKSRHWSSITKWTYGKDLKVSSNTFSRHLFCFTFLGPQRVTTPLLIFSKFTPIPAALPWKLWKKHSGRCESSTTHGWVYSAQDRASLREGSPPFTHSLKNHPQKTVSPVTQNVYGGGIFRVELDGSLRGKKRKEKSAFTC